LPPDSGLYRWNLTTVAKILPASDRILPRTDGFLLLVFFHKSQMPKNIFREIKKKIDFIKNIL
jgi:hypothetical protein